MEITQLHLSRRNNNAGRTKMTWIEIFTKRELDDFKKEVNNKLKFMLEQLQIERRVSLELSERIDILEKSHSKQKLHQEEKRQTIQK